MNKLYLAIMSPLLATSLTACGSSGSEEGGEITVVDATLKEASTYKNNLFCNNPSTAVEDICNIRMYQIMVEAFNNGDDTINYDVGYGTSNHKGDIQGVIDQLNYIILERRDVIDKSWYNRDAKTKCSNGYDCLMT